MKSLCFLFVLGLLTAYPSAAFADEDGLHASCNFNEGESECRPVSDDGSAIRPHHHAAPAAHLARVPSGGIVCGPHETYVTVGGWGLAGCQTTARNNVPDAPPLFHWDAPLNDPTPASEYPQGNCRSMAGLTVCMH